MVEYPFVSSQAIIDKTMIGGLTPLWHNIHQIWNLMFLQINPSYALHSCINKNAPIFFVQIYLYRMKWSKPIN